MHHRSRYPRRSVRPPRPIQFRHLASLVLELVLHRGVFCPLFEIMLGPPIHNIIELNTLQL